jgi:hypothetical protein
LYRKLKPLHPDLKGPLIWYQPKHVVHIYELRCENDYFATLLIHHQRRYLYSLTTATAVTAQEGWTFRHSNEIMPDITITNLGAFFPYATFVFWNFNQGMLWLTNNSRFLWERYEKEYSWSFLHNSESILHFREIEFSSKKGAEVFIPEKSWNLSELVILTLLGWFLILTMSQT